MRTSRTRKKNKIINANRIYFFGILFAAGAFSGTIIAFLSKDSLLKPNNLYLSRQYYLSDFFALCFKYFKLPAAIWFSAFVRAGIIAIPVLLFIKGTGLAFACASMGAGYGRAEVIYPILLLCVQNFVLAFAYIYLAETGFKFMRDKTFKLKEYLYCFLFSSLFIFTAVLAEIFVFPAVINLLR